MFIFQKHLKVLTVILLVGACFFLVRLILAVTEVYYLGILDTLIMALYTVGFGYAAYRHLRGWIRSDPQATKLYERIWDRLELIRLLSPGGRGSVERSVQVDDATVRVEWRGARSSFSYSVSAKVANNDGELITREWYDFPVKAGYVARYQGEEFPETTGEDLRYQLSKDIVWKLLLAGSDGPSDWRAASRDDLVTLEAMLEKL